MDTIGRYRLERRLGAGSFATVWLGHDDDLDVPVAVKVLAENWAGNADVRNRFLGEARILRRIRDPRIVAVYDIGTTPDDRPYFVMDFIDGGSLNDLRKNGVAPAEALRLCAQACRAIDVLHAHHVLHRDVTPGNLLIQRKSVTSTGDGAPLVVLADLGVAKAMAETSELTMTAGTPAYMAPEQAAGGHLDRRVDVYALTAVTYAMLSRRPPYVVRTIADIVGRDPSAAPPPLAAALGAPPSLDTVLEAGLAYRPDRRPPTAAILADALDVVAAELETGTSRAPSNPNRDIAQPSYAAQPPSARSPLPAPARAATPSANAAPEPAPHTVLSPSPPVQPRPQPVLQPVTRQVAQPADQGAVAADPGPPNGSAPQPAAARSKPAAAPAMPNHAPTAAPDPPRRRSPVTFVVLVALACAVLFVGSLLITIVVLR